MAPSSNPPGGGSGCATDPVLGRTARDLSPVDGRWGPDLPMYGICPVALAAEVHIG